MAVFDPKSLASGVYNPVASPNQNLKPSTSVAMASPGIYAASMKTGLTSDESTMIEGWAVIHNKHKELMGMGNAQADAAYKKLDENTRGLLDAYYGINYARRPEGGIFSTATGNKILGGQGNDGYSLGDLAKSPFRAVLAAGEGYGRGINAPGRQIQLAATGQEVKINESFSNEAIFNPEYTQPLIEKYGPQKSFVATSLLKGMTPGEIIEAWGPNDADMLMAVGEIFDDTPEFHSMLSEFEQAQLSPGRTMAHQQFQDLNIKPEDHPWLWKTFSGSGDLAYQLLIDPMTYATFGLGPLARMGITKSGKTAQLLKGTRSVTEHFADPKVKEFWTGFSKQLGDYGDAVKAKDTAKATELRMTMKSQYPEYANDGIIELFTKGKIDPLTNQTVGPIRDVESAQSFFEAANMTSLLARGRVSGIKFQREGIAMMQRGRNIKTGIRLKTREVLKGRDSFDNLDTDTLDNLANQLAEAGARVDGNFDFAEINKTIDSNRKKGINGWLDRMSARHPGYKEIYTSDEKYLDTLDLVREQAFLAIGDKRMAETIAIKFSNSTQAERIALRKSLDELTMRKVGMDKVAGGERKIREILDSKYGVKGSMSAADELRLPARATATGEIGTTVRVEGTLLPFQNTSALGSLPWNEIKHFMAGKTFDEVAQLGAEGTSKTDKAKILPEIIGGAFNHRVTDLAMDVWSAFTLAPRLGIRTAIDELTFLTMYASTGLARELLMAKSAQNVLTAATGSKAGVGPVKNSIQAVVSKFPGINVGAIRKIAPEEKLAIKNNYDEMYKRGEIELHEVQERYQSDILDMAIDRVGGRFLGKLTDDRKNWLKQAAVGNIRILENASAASLADVVSSRAGAVLPEASLLTDSHLTTALKEFEIPGRLGKGVDIGETYELAKDLEANKLYLAMFHNFVTAFATKPYKLSNGERLSPASLFITHNGLKTGEDWAAAKSQFMQKIGFGDTGNGTFELIDEDLARSFLEQSRQNLDDGRTINQIASDFADASFAELTHRFHGSAEDINEAFVDYFKTQANADGTPMPAYAVASDISFEKYRELVGDFTVKDGVRTAIDFGPKTAKAEVWIRKYGLDKMFSVMTRTTDDLFRQPVVHAHYFMYRKQYAQFESQYSDQIFKSLEDDAIANNRVFDAEKARKRADHMSARFFTENAMEDAVHHTLKYSDNPEIRSVFAVNVRTVGRFYRAVEDFHRRMYRLVGEHGLDAVYRARLIQQGLASVGTMHKDEDGQLYLVMPMDDAVFQAVDSTLSQLPGWKGSGVNQPLFSDITFKLSAGNPSFQDDAGVPYLAGPVASLSVMGVKAFLGMFDGTKNFAEDVDNYALGNLGDNVNIKTAIVPRSLQLAYSVMAGDEKDQHEVSAAMMAISYYQANGMGVYPEDYINPDGTKNEDEYLKALRQYQEDVQLTAHNIIVLRNFLGLVSPIGPQLRDTKDLPTYLKDVGITSMSSSFYETLDEVERFYPAADDHYELALGVWTGKNRGKLAYIPSRNESSVAATYSKDMQDWVLENNDAVEKYGNAAIMFAPKIGDFSPGVYNWAKGAELINQKDIKEYLDEVTMQDSVNKYFELDDEETAQIQGTPLADDRRSIIMRFEERKRLMKISTPILESRVANMADNEEKTRFLNNVYLAANDENVNIAPEVRESVNNAYDVYNNFLNQIERDEVRLASNSAAIKRHYKEQAMLELFELAKSDESGAVKELIRNSLRGLMNAKSRDAQNTIN